MGRYSSGPTKAALPTFDLSITEHGLTEGSHLWQEIDEVKRIKGIKRRDAATPTPSPSRLFFAGGGGGLAFDLQCEDIKWT